MDAYHNIIVELNLLLERLTEVVRDPQDLTTAAHEEATHLSAILDMCLILQSAHDPDRVLPAIAHLCRVLGTHAVEHTGFWGSIDVLHKPRPGAEEDADGPNT
jgi:hypothetical protein